MLNIIFLLGSIAAFAVAMGFKHEDEDGLAFATLGVATFFFGIFYFVFVVFMPDVMSYEARDSGSDSVMTFAFWTQIVGLAICVAPYVFEFIVDIFDSISANAKNRRVQKQIKKRERAKQKESKKLYIEKNKQIKRENAHIDEQIKRYKELQKQTTCTVITVKPCRKITLLFSMLDSASAKELTKLLSGYENIAKEKSDIEKAVNNLARLYRDIGNNQEADNLLKNIRG